MSLKAMKLIRLAIMQIKPGEKELRTYRISVKELANILNVNENNIHSAIPELMPELMENLFFIGERVYNCTSSCEYVPDDGIYIRLNEKLKPLFFYLKTQYTQYPLESIMQMDSEYSIRFFEMILEKVNGQILPENGFDVYISMEEIKDICGCDTKAYDEFSKIKQKVIDKSISEIEKHTAYRVSYTKNSYLKQGRTVVGITFTINMIYHIKILNRMFWRKKVSKTKL